MVNLFLDHRTIEVVRAEALGNLGDFRRHHDPVGFDVREVVEQQAREVRQILETHLREVTDPVEAEGTPLVVSVEGDIEGSQVEVEARLVDTDVRPISSNEVVRRWREAIGEIPGIRSLTFDAERGGGPERRRAA